MASDLAQSAIRAAWSHLDASSIHTGELIGRRPSADAPAEILCAVNRAGSRYFLIAVGDVEDELVDDSTRGLSVSTQRLEVAGEAVRRYVSVQCSDASAYDLFDVIGSELLTAVASAPQKPRDAAKSVLDRWKRFWSDLPRSVMSDEQIAGLFGELWFIHVWLSVAVGVPVAIKVWRGPYGARHDFEARSLSIEVKTTTARAGRTHRIHGIEQLAEPEVGSLMLFSIAIQREGGATNSLVVLIDAIRSLLQSDPEAANTFDTALARSGYSDAFRNYYVERTFRVVNALLFEVGGPFPRLTKSELVSGALMPAVSGLEYDIDLGGLQTMAVADRPDAASAMLRSLAD